MSGLHAGLLLLIAQLWAAPSSAEGEAGERNEPLAYAAVGVRGEAIDLRALRDQWVVVNFWATWCKPCRKEIPDLSELHEQRQDITVLGLAFEEVEVPEILAFLQQHPAAYPIALIDVYDPPDVFDVPRVLPTTLILSPEGRLVKTFIGPVTREGLEAFVDQAAGGGS
jgi:thiol-disulfide isomerase/thioredoxin